MPISFVNSATDSSSTTVSTFTATRPTGTAAGDLMLAFVSRTAATSGTTLSGWTKVEELLQTNGQPGSMALYYLVASDGDPASWTGTLETTSAAYVCTVASYRGCEIPAFTDTVDYSMATDPNNLTSYSSDTLTTVSGDWAVASIGAGRNSGFDSVWNTPANYAERNETHTGSSSVVHLDQQTVDSNGSDVGTSESVTFSGATACDNGTTVIVRLRPKPNLDRPLIFGTVW